MTNIEPARVEAEEIETVTVEWQGFSLDFPASVDDWDVDTVAAFEEGKAIVAIQKLLGPRRVNEISNRFRELHGRAVKVRDYSDLMDAIARVMGFESQGESAASSA